jgi:D-aspartate ligase
VTPDPQDEEAFVSFLEKLDVEGAPVFATHDEPLNAIARAAGRLGGRFLYPFPPWEELATIQTKRGQLDAAERAGVAAPRTAHPGSAAEARTAAGLIGFPVLVKPSSTEGFKRRFGRQAFRCETAAEVEGAYGDAEPYEPMVQEVIPGGDDELYTLGSYLSPDGEALGLFCGRKLRQTPPGIGTCRVGEAVWVARDGAYKLMEVNPRLFQWHGLAASCGVDLPLIAYRDLTGERVEPVSADGTRKRWAITLQAGESPAVQRPPYVDAVFARDDLKPALVQVARLLRR